MKKANDFNNLVDMMDSFPDEQSCIDHLTSIRWKDGAFCPFCGSLRVYHFKDKRTHKCAECRKRFSIKIGTVFEESKIALRKWFIAIYLITAHKKGISSLQLSRDLGVTQKTAWFMLHRLRFASQTKDFKAPLGNTVEVDETFVGGKEWNRHKSKRRKGTQGRDLKTKTGVLGLVERGGRVKAFKISSLKGQKIKSHILDNVVIGTKIMTDEYRSYCGLEPFYTHDTVNHGHGQYVKGNAHTNTIEGFFSLLKRGILGIYHYVSPKHIDRYLNEFVFRYNLRNSQNGFGFQVLLENCGGRLTYRELSR